MLTHEQVASRLPDARPYLRKGDFRARPVDVGELVIRIDDVDVPLDPTDWIVSETPVGFGVPQAWPVKKSVFDATYEYNVDDVDPRDSRFVFVEKFTWTSMVQVPEEFECRSAEGVRRGRAGDFAAFGVASEIWPISPEVVGEKYELVERPADDPGRVFISYAHEDAPNGSDAHVLLTRLRDNLEGRGLIVFFDDQSLRGGDMWRERILRELATADLFIVAIGQGWFTNPKSVARRRELPLAWLSKVERGAKSLPLLLDMDAPVLMERVAVFANPGFSFKGVDCPHPRATVVDGKVPEKAAVIQAYVSDAVRCIRETRAAQRSLPRIPGGQPISQPAPPPSPPSPVPATNPNAGSTGRSIGAIGDGPWVVTMTGATAHLVTVDDTELRGVFDSKGQPVGPVDFGQTIEGLVASDDGTALAVALGAVVEVFELGHHPRIWRSGATPIRFELPDPSCKLLAMRREGRTYVLRTASDLGRHTLTIDASGGCRQINSTRRIKSSAAAGRDFLDVNLLGGLTDHAISGALSDSGIETWTWVDSAKVDAFLLGDSAPEIVAGLGCTDDGEALIAVVWDGSLLTTSVDRAMTKVAVPRLSTSGTSLTILGETRRKVYAWDVDALRPLSRSSR